METFKEFSDRIMLFEKKQISFGNKDFNVNPSVLKKVGKDNKFKKFYGDTVVFGLDKKIKEKLAQYSEILYGSAPECFCEKLNPSFFHVTLHDLSSSETLADISKDMVANENNIRKNKSEIQKYAARKIAMKSNYIFNMVNASLVLGLRPVDAEGYLNLMDLYSVFDGIKKLNYPFTPHITLAYFNVNGFNLESAKELEKSVNRINNNQFELELNVNDLYYQKFESMNDYSNIIKFCV